MTVLSLRLVCVALFAFDLLLPLTMAHTYQPAMDGACRGPGGELDKVNSKHKPEASADACKQDCDAETHCVGYSYHPTANGGECIVYGPAMAGSCSNSDASSPTACAELGTCADTSSLTEETCGSCSEPSAPSKATCLSVTATWTAHTWTSAGATWTDAANPWTGEWHSSVIIKGFAATAGYKCYDIDPTDHEAKCVGSANCVAAFANKAADVQIAANCPSGCTFTAAVTATRVVTVHAPAIQMTGYTVKSGACRGPASAKVNGKYSKTAGASGGPLTQQECAAACDAETKCVGYAHSTAWCVVYGPGIDDTPGASWTSDTHAATTIVGTKPNAAYICSVKGSGVWGTTSTTGTAGASVTTGTSGTTLVTSNSRGYNGLFPLSLVLIVIASTAWMHN